MLFKEMYSLLHAPQSFCWASHGSPEHLPPHGCHGWGCRSWACGQQFDQPLGDLNPYDLLGHDQLASLQMYSLHYWPFSGFFLTTLSIGSLVTRKHPTGSFLPFSSTLDLPSKFFLPGSSVITWHSWKRTWEYTANPLDRWHEETIATH